MFRDLQNFGLQSHKYNLFSAIVPAATTKKDLEDGKFWSNVANKLQSGDELRCLSDNSDFVARLIVLFVNGTDVRVKCESYIKLDDVKLETYNADPDYEIKNGGAAGWWIKKKSTSEKVLYGIKTQALAFQALAEYKQSLAA